MALPKVNHAIFNLLIPSLGEEYKFRSLLVKDEKILLMAQNSGDSKDIILAIKQAVNNCALDEIDVDTLTTFDLEYLFIKLRAKSINNIIELKYNDPVDNEQYKISIDIDKIEVLNLEKQNNKIDINDTMGMILSYPTASTLAALNVQDDETELFFSILKYCIKTIYDRDKTYNVGDYTPNEIEEFISDLDVKTLQKVQKFFEEMPKIHYTAHYKGKDGSDRKLELNTINDFFMLG